MDDIILSLKLSTGCDRHAETDTIDINIAMLVIPPVETLLHQYRTYYLLLGIMG
jgi:hypothetical protein